MGSKTDRRYTTQPSLPVGMTTHANRTARLAMDARHHLERRDLYRSKAAGPHAASRARLRDLERAYDDAVGRLEAAEASAFGDVSAMLASGAAARSRREPVSRLRLVASDTLPVPGLPTLQ
jgi:hypothetical protein